MCLAKELGSPKQEDPNFITSIQLDSYNSTYSIKLLASAQWPQWPSPLTLWLLNLTLTSKSNQFIFVQDALRQQFENPSMHVLYRARQKKSNPLGKILYLWNCSRFFHQIYGIYRRGFKPHILQILLKWHMWFNRYNSLNFKVHFFKWTYSGVLNNSVIMNQTLHNFFVNSCKRFSDECQLPSRYLNPASRPTHDNPMDWDLANSLAIRFFQWNRGVSSWSSPGQELLCEKQ